MRYDAEHKQKTRGRLVKEAAKAIRSKGPHRIGVAKVMARAGLTHGGFYAHFASKDDLVAAAIEQTFQEAQARIRRDTQDRTAAEGLTAYVDFYLSAEHRDGRTDGCPLPFLSADIPRLPRSSRVQFAAGVAQLVETLAGHLMRLGRADARAEASSMLAELFGALSLARAEPDRRRSNGILARSRSVLKQRLGLEESR
jgi:TetR/AcrR family transcriptional repressor of nem operon